ncbi:MAG: hypothetical protein FWH28_03280 [Clostridiales bacterium]|nr:hypothetical protein [Clostridiales bacterium]
MVKNEDIVGDDNYKMMEELSDPIRGGRHFKLNDYADYPVRITVKTTA